MWIETTLKLIILQNVVWCYLIFARKSEISCNTPWYIFSCMNDRTCSKFIIYSSPHPPWIWGCFLEYLWHSSLPITQHQSDLLKALVTSHPHKNLQRFAQPPHYLNTSNLFKATPTTISFNILSWAHFRLLLMLDISSQFQWFTSYIYLVWGQNILPP